MSLYIAYLVVVSLWVMAGPLVNLWKKRSPIFKGQDATLVIMVALFWAGAAFDKFYPEPKVVSAQERAKRTATKIAELAQTHQVQTNVFTFPPARPWENTNFITRADIEKSLSSMTNRVLLCMRLNEIVTRPGEQSRETRGLTTVLKGSSATIPVAERVVVQIELLTTEKIWNNIQSRRSPRRPDDYPDQDAMVVISEPHVETNRHGHYTIRGVAQHFEWYEIE